jgi:hypothetical protein
LRQRGLSALADFALLVSKTAEPSAFSRTLAAEVLGVDVL